MSKRITPRSIEEINNEYAHLCAQLGENRYKITRLEQANNELMNRIDEINDEAKRAMDVAKSQAKAPVAEEQKAPATPSEADNAVSAG